MAAATVALNTVAPNASLLVMTLPPFFIMEVSIRSLVEFGK
jgi:hypothetical protein